MQQALLLEADSHPTVVDESVSKTKQIRVRKGKRFLSQQWSRLSSKLNVGQGLVPTGRMIPSRTGRSQANPPPMRLIATRKTKTGINPTSLDLLVVTVVMILFCSSLEDCGGWLCNDMCACLSPVSDANGRC